MYAKEIDLDWISNIFIESGRLVFEIPKLPTQKEGLGQYCQSYFLKV